MIFLFFLKLGKKKSTFGWSIICLVSTQNDFLTMFDHKFTLDCEHEKMDRYFSLKKKKGSSVILNICKTVMERC